MMKIDHAYLTPRGDLHPDWVQLELIIREEFHELYESTFQPGTQIQVGHLVLETIEYAVAGEAVMCRVVKDYRPKANGQHGYELFEMVGMLRKYAAVPPVPWWHRVWRWVRGA